MLNTYLAHLPASRLSFTLHLTDDKRAVLAVAVRNKKDLFVKRQARELLASRLQEALTVLSSNDEHARIPNIAVSVDEYLGHAPKKQLFFPLLDFLRGAELTGPNSVNDLMNRLRVLLNRLVYKANRTTLALTGDTSL